MILDVREVELGRPDTPADVFESAPSTPGPSRRSAAVASPLPPTDPDLTALVRRAQSGDQAAQAELVRRYRVRLAAFIRPMVKRPAEVEDLVQIVWIKLVRRVWSLREPARFETWLFTLARNTVLDAMRRSRCRPETLVDENLLHSLPDPHRREGYVEIMEAVQVALRECGPRDRRVLQQLIEGSSYRAIALREGVSITSLKVRIHRLRLFLRVSVRAATGDKAPTANGAD